MMAPWATLLPELANSGTSRLTTRPTLASVPANGRRARWSRSWPTPEQAGAARARLGERPCQWPACALVPELANSGTSRRSTRPTLASVPANGRRTALVPELADSGTSRLSTRPPWRASRSIAARVRWSRSWPTPEQAGAARARPWRASLPMAGLRRWSRSWPTPGPTGVPRVDAPTAKCHHHAVAWPSPQAPEHVG